MNSPPPKPCAASPTGAPPPNCLTTTRKLKRENRRGKQTWPREWDQLEVPEDNEAAHIVVTDCAKRLAAMTSKLRELKNSGNLARAKRLMRVALVSDSAKIAALAYSVRHKRGAKAAKASARSIMMNARKIDMWTDSGEPVLWSVDERGNGKERITYLYGVIEYARQYLALRLSRATEDTSPRQFIDRGGMSALVAWMNEFVPKAKVVITTDVPNCFLALIRKCLEVDGPLPGAVMKSVLTDPMDRAKRRPLKLRGGDINSSMTPDHYGCGAGSGLGIPPGAALATLAADVSLRPILYAVEDAAEGVMAASMGDNIIILALSVKAAIAAKSALLAAASDRMSQQAVNGLRTRIVTSRPKEGFKFVGSVFRKKKGILTRRRPKGFHTKLVVRLSNGLQEGTLTKPQALRSLNAWEKANSFEPKAAKHAAKFRDLWDLDCPPPPMPTVLTMPDGADLSVLPPWDEGKNHS